MFPFTKHDPDNGQGSHVTIDGEDFVTSMGVPPLRPQKQIPFRQYFTDDGLANGTKQMGVDGSVTNVDYYIEADEDNDRYISSLSFIIGYGATAQPNEFADGLALTNGVRIFYDSGKGESDLHDAIKTNQDMFRLSLKPVPTAWEVRHVNANNDYGYFISTEFNRWGFKHGIKLEHGTKQRFVIRIRDDITFADSFNCIAYGFDRFK